MKSPTILGLLAGALSFGALAQQNFTFTVRVAAGDAEVTPTLTWNAEGAAGCDATGSAAWAGPKAASGEETLPPVSQTQTYSLTCTWSADTTATLTWTNPTLNTDGSPLTDLDLIRIKWTFNPTVTSGSACAAGETCVDVPQTTPTETQVVDVGSQTGTFRAVGLARNSQQVFSVVSNEATKMFTGSDTVSKTVGVVVTIPTPPDVLVVQ